MATRKAKVPPKLNLAEETFSLHCRVEKLTPERQHKFHEIRGWRIDFAWPERKLAVELEGGVHRINKQYMSDMEKFNALNREGWMLLRYTLAMVKSGQAINEVLAALGQ